MRIRFCALLLALILCLPGGLAEAFCVAADGMAAIISDDGVQMLGENGFTDCFALVAGELFAFGWVTREGSLYEVWTKDGVRLTEDSYGMIIETHGALVYRQGHLYGALTLSGEPLIPAEYTQLATADGVCFLAVRTDPNDDDPDQVWRLRAGEEPQALALRLESGLGSFHDGLMLYQDADTEKYGFLDGAGAVAIPALYDAAEAFSGGVAKVCLNGRYGLIDSQGNQRVPCEYAYMERGDEMILAETDAGALDLYDAAGSERRFSLPAAHTSAWLAGSYLAVSGAEATELYDASGQRVCACGPLASVRAGINGDVILSDGLWGEACAWVLSRDGVAWERREQQLMPCGALYACAAFRAVAYISPELGEIRYSCDRESFRVGLLSADGAEVVPAEYLDISCVAEDAYLLISEDAWRVVNGRGDTIWSISFLREADEVG